MQSFVSLWKSTLKPMYRTMLRYGNGIQEKPLKQKTLSDLRSFWRENELLKTQLSKSSSQQEGLLTDEQDRSLKLFIAECEAKMGFLRMVSTKIISSNLRKKDSVTLFKFKNGKVIEVGKDEQSKESTHFANLNRLQLGHAPDPEDMKRHVALLRRQHFMDRK